MPIIYIVSNFSASISVVVFVLSYRTIAFVYLSLSNVLNDFST